MQSNEFRPRRGVIMMRKLSFERSMRMSKFRLTVRAVVGAAVVGGTLFSAGCIQTTRVTEGTTPRHYPYEAPALQVIDIQVFRADAEIQLVNMTANSYADFDLWLNERYVRRVGNLPAGGTVRLSLFEFVDEHAEGLKAGGFLSTGEPDPIIKVEIETPEGMLGLIAIPDRGK